jgi:SAM-dependent methyltransferase
MTDAEPPPDPVEAQYSRWVYPQPATSLRRIWQNCDPMLLSQHYAYWPDREYWPGMRILAAGCGSNQAANLAHRNPGAQVLGIDVSAASLAHEQILKDKYGLDNLRLERRAIEQLDALDQEFDLVIASGVIHHLPDPAAAMAALGRRLAPHGVLYVMVYGRYFRAGVYMMQELFRRLGLGQTPADVAAVRRTLAGVQDDHLVRNYMRAVQDIEDDAGIVDTFLHTADQAYTVDECLALVDAAGLTFQGWLEPTYYHPNGQMTADHPLFARLEALPPRQMWAAMELHHGGAGRHEFFVCRPDRPTASWQLPFDTDAFFDLVPVRRVTQLTAPDPARGRPAAILRAPFPEVPLTDAQLRLFEMIDGRRSIARCLTDSAITAGDPGQLRAFARQFFTSLWRLGYALLKF